MNHLDFVFTREMKKEAIMNTKFEKSILHVHTNKGTYLGRFVDIDDNILILRHNQITPNLTILIDEIWGIAWEQDG